MSEPGALPSVRPLCIFALWPRRCCWCEAVYWLERMWQFRTFSSLPVNRESAKACAAYHRATGCDRLRATLARPATYNVCQQCALTLNDAERWIGYVGGQWDDARLWDEKQTAMRRGVVWL